ncbi:MAG: hypothetical protein Q7J68_05985 [Thermoplasmata archaeon]|nr:hypothetical protein [Thermoplasmata archaeon]
MDGITKLSQMEAKILELGKKQYDRGYARGTFTPGFIKKETNYAYRAINTALESLISQELVEKTVTSTFRNGVLVELDVYNITNDGILALEKIGSGNIKVNADTRPVSRRPDFTSESKPWERPSPSPPRTFERREPSGNSPELVQIVKKLEEAMKTMTQELQALHIKMDKMMMQKPKVAEAQIPLSEPKKRKSRAGSSEGVKHRVMILTAIRELESNRDDVLAEDIKATYFKECSGKGISPKGQAQFTTFLKKLEGEKLLDLKRVGCRNLGIKGHGSRVVVKITKEGEDFLVKNQ